MADNDGLIDLRCKACGKNFTPDKREGMKVVKMENGSVLYTQNDEEIYLTCTHCQSKAMIFKPAPVVGSGKGFSGAVAKGNSAVAVGAGSMYIHGNVESGSNFVFGNNNKIGKE